MCTYEYAEIVCCNVSKIVVEVGWRYVLNKTRNVETESPRKVNNEATETKRNDATKKPMYIYMCFPRSFKKVKIAREYNSTAKPKVEEAKIKCSAAM